MQDNAFDLASQRVDHALRRFQDSWFVGSGAAISQDLDELDVAVGLWLYLGEAEERTDDVPLRLPAAVPRDDAFERPGDSG